MTNCLPPTTFTGIPELTDLPAGKVLYRVHPKAYPADSFNPDPSHRYYGGGRFDATADDAYPFLYAGESIEVALAETLLRDVVYGSSGEYQLPPKYYLGKRISAVRTLVDLSLVSMLTRGQLSAVAQTTWITTCPPTEYAQSRHWGHWIRAQAPTAAGYMWRSRQDPAQLAYVFFGDRHAGGSIQTVDDPAVPSGDAADFDTPEGIRMLKLALAPHRVVV